VPTFETEGIPPNGKPALVVPNIRGHLLHQEDRCLHTIYFSAFGSSPNQKKRTAIPKANFRIEHHGSIILIVPLCASARDWLDEHLGKENGYQPYWPTAIVEPRFLAQIIAGIRRDGLVAR
jgi:hypothetical protein